MTRSEYQELVEFVGKKSDRMDQRFDAMDRRLDGIADRLRNVEVSVEENRHLIQIVAERVTGFREEMGREFVAVRQEMSDGFQLQGTAIRSLTARMDRWEGLSA
jgi:CDP-diacylglycerol pyrophosphatase